MDCSPPGSSIHGILQATVLGWGAMRMYIKHLSMSGVHSKAFNKWQQKLNKQIFLKELFLFSYSLTILIWLWQAQCDATNLKLYQINFTAWGFLGHTGSTDSKLNCDLRSMFMRISTGDTVSFSYPPQSRSQNRLSSLVCFLGSLLAGVCWLPVPWGWSAPGGAGFMQKSHFQHPTQQAPKVCLLGLGKSHTLNPGLKSDMPSAWFLLDISKYFSELASVPFPAAKWTLGMPSSSLRSPEFPGPLKV